MMVREVIRGGGGKLASVLADIWNTERRLGCIVGSINDALLADSPLRSAVSSALRDRLGNLARIAREERVHVDLVK